MDRSGLKTFGQQKPHSHQATRHTSSKLPGSRSWRYGWEAMTPPHFYLGG